MPDVDGEVCLLPYEIILDYLERWREGESFIKWDMSYLVEYVGTKRGDDR